MSCCLLETATLRKIATLLFVGPTSVTPTKRGGFHRDIRFMSSVRNRERARMSDINLVESHDFIASRFSITPACRRRTDMKKVKASHTRYRALGPELIPVYIPKVTVSHPLGGRLPLLSAAGLRLPSKPQSITALWPVPSYTAW